MSGVRVDDDDDDGVRSPPRSCVHATDRNRRESVSLYFSTSVPLRELCGPVTKSLSKWFFRSVPDGYRVLARGVLLDTHDFWSLFHTRQRGRVVEATTAKGTTSSPLQELPSNRGKRNLSKDKGRLSRPTDNCLE